MTIVAVILANSPQFKHHPNFSAVRLYIFCWWQVPSQMEERIKELKEVRNIMLLIIMAKIDLISGT